MNINKTVEKILSDLFKEKTLPCMMTSLELFNLVKERWPIAGIEPTKNLVGKSMSRMGYQSYRNACIRGWIIDKV